MCLILFAYRTHPAYRLVVAANRDEFYGRPTSAASVWPDRPSILAGRDLARGGTWMGVSTDGKFAALTNYRDPKESTDGKRSRGELVANYLDGDATPEAYVRRAAREAASYPGYNLLVGDRHELYFYSNVERVPKRLPPGVYGVSNHLLDTPWPKVEKGKAGLAALLAEGESLEPSSVTERLFALLADAEPAPDALLPNTGVSREWERKLSSMFIRSVDDAYGTRCSTVLLMTDADMWYAERTHERAASGAGTADEATNRAADETGALRDVAFRIVL